MTSKTLQMCVALVAMASVVCLASTASAQYEPEPTRWEERPIALDLHGGFGGPAGRFGASLSGFVTPNLGLTVSGGFGATGNGVSVTPKVQIAWDELALSVGVGLGWFSLDYVRSDLFCCSAEEYRADLVQWGHGEVQLTYQNTRGIRAGGYVGLARIMDSWNARSREADSPNSFEPETTEGLPYTDRPAPFIGFFAGYAF